MQLSLRAPGPLQTILGHIERVGGALRLRYREAEDTIGLVRAVFAEARGASPASVAPQAVTPARGKEGFARTAVLDAVALGEDRLALLRRAAPDETAVHIIDGVGPSLWQAADGVSFDELVAAAVRRHGAPVEGEASDAVRAAVEALCRAGLLEERPGIR